MRALRTKQTGVLLSRGRIRFSPIPVRKASNFTGDGHPLAAEKLCLAADRLELTSLLRSQSKSKALVDGRLTHAYIVSCGLDHDKVILNCIIQLYGSCGFVKDARHVFDGLHHPNIFSCNIMINVYNRNGPLDAARDLFNGMLIRDIITWNAMIAACVHHGSYEEALDLFRSMQHHGMAYDHITFISVLDACAGSCNIEAGQKVHISVVYVGLEDTLNLSNALISFYGKLELVDDAQAVFSKLSHGDIVSWTTMLSAFVIVKNGYEALNTFCVMHLKGVEPDKIAHICALDACAIMSENEYGQLIHSALVENRSDIDIVASTALINMYGECGSVYDARNIFARMLVHDVVAWTAMLVALSRNMHSVEALQLFHKMQVEGVCPNTVTFVFALDACSGLPSLVDGQDIHVTVVFRGIESDEAISVCLVNLYGKCGCMDDAKAVFNRILNKNVVAWSTMIMSCTQNGCGKEALSLFHRMQAEGTKPNNVTFLCLVDACTNLEALEEGHAVDDCLCKCGYGKDVIICNALMNMYRKCGDLQKAIIVFDRMPYHNLVSWTAFIAAFSQMGCGQNALMHFQKMLSEGISPDNITFTCVLTACSHAGLVEGGWSLFSAMLTDFGIPQTIDHFVCMIDLLGRVGHLGEADALLSHAPFQNLALPWLSLLGACQSCGDVTRGLRAALSYVELNPESASPFTILGNIVTVQDKTVSVVPIINLFCESGDWMIPHELGVA
ncbi:hypothetical protein GOP47_0030405 [Adiantum capillus-veneris]|nr:hypothetical protein GOP47_0030405 [Adiantum capillus-veneris]